MVQKTFLHASIQALYARNLEPAFELSLGCISKPSEAAKMQSYLSENNPDYLFLVNLDETLNPDYSPLNEALHETDK